VVLFLEKIISDWIACGPGVFLDKGMAIPEFLALYFFGITKRLRSGAFVILTAFILVDL
jgi:hypothetical protein